MEIDERLTDRVELRGRGRAHHLIGFGFEPLAHGRRAHRYRHDHPSRGAYGPHRGEHGRSGGDSVVDQDHRPPGEFGCGPVTAVGPLATRQFDRLAPDGF